MIDWINRPGLADYMSMRLPSLTPHTNLQRRQRRNTLVQHRHCSLFAASQRARVYLLIDQLCIEVEFLQNPTKTRGSRVSVSRSLRPLNRGVS